jgi:hypothetical protein
MVNREHHHELWNPEYLVNLGMVYKTCRLHRKAREIFQKALRCDPKHTEARKALQGLPAEAGLPKRRKNLWEKLLGK